MGESMRSLAEAMARATPRRRLLGRAAGALFALLAGGAAGNVGRRVALAGQGTVCSPPGPVCDCGYCNLGVCQKPCVINTTWYASGCWVASGGVTCCDCTCPAPQGICGCASDVCP